MSDVKFCTNCGTELKEGVRFCTECGTKVEVVDTFADFQQPINSSVPEQVAKTGNNKTKGIVLAGGILVVLAVIFVIYKSFFSYPSDPGDVAVKFLNAMMVDYDADEAEKYIDMSMVSEGDIDEVCDSVKLMNVKISKIKVTNKEVDGNYAEIEFTATMSFLGEKEENEGTVSLEKMDGKWKVVDFN